MNETILKFEQSIVNTESTHVKKSYMYLLILLLHCYKYIFQSFITCLDIILDSFLQIDAFVVPLHF
jgi:hypothetical protein